MARIASTTHCGRPPENRHPDSQDVLTPKPLTCDRNLTHNNRRKRPGGTMDKFDMKGFKSPDFADRQATADAARKAAVEKFRTRPRRTAPNRSRVSRSGVNARASVSSGTPSDAPPRKSRRVKRPSATPRQPPKPRAEAPGRRARVADAETNKAREAEMENERKAARDARYAAPRPARNKPAL